MATDAEIRARGLKYIPKQKYLQNPYELPVEETPAEDGGIVNTNAFNNSASGGFYNDDNRITNKNYNPNPLQDARFSNETSFVGAPETDFEGRNPGQIGFNPNTAGVSYNTRTEAMKNMEMNNNVNRNNDGSRSLTGQNVTGNYYGLDEPEQSKFEQFARNVPILGTGIKAVELGGKFLSKILPTSKRAYLENELRGSGIYTDNIGRIVQGEGDYNTAQNVMANYNANKITQETLNKRIKTINDTIKRKTKSYETKGQDYTTTKSFKDLTKRIGAINEYGDINNIVNKNADFIKKNPKEEEEFKFFDDNVITRFLKKKKSSNTTTGTGTTSDNDGTTTGVSYDASGDDNITDRRDSDFDGSVGLGSNANAVRAAMRDNDPNTGSAQSYNQNLADGGRAGYFFGGRVNFKGGGMDASSDDFGTSTSAPGPGDTGGEGGDNPSDGSDSQFGGGDNDGASDSQNINVSKQIQKAIKKKLPKTKEAPLMSDTIKKYFTLSNNNRNSPFFRNSEPKVINKNLYTNNLTDLNIQYPNIDIKDEYGYIQGDKAKTLIDKAIAEGTISPVDGLNLTRSIDTTGTQSNTSGDYTMGNFNFNSPNIEEGILNSSANYNLGDFNLNANLNTNDSTINDSRLGFNYDDGAVTGSTYRDNDYGYTTNKLGVDKTFNIGDNFKVGLDGSYQEDKFKDGSYYNADLTPSLTYDDGTFNANLSKEIVEGGTQPSLKAGFEKNGFYGQGNNLLGDPKGKIGFQYTSGPETYTSRRGEFNKQGVNVTGGIEIDPFTGEKTAGIYGKYNFKNGGLAGLL